MRTTLIIVVILLLAIVAIYWYRSGSNINVNGGANIYGTDEPGESYGPTASGSVQVSPTGSNGY